MVKNYFVILMLLSLSSCQILELTDSTSDNDNLIVIHDVAMNAYEKKDWAKAEPALLQLTKKFTTDPQVWFKLGNIYARDNRAKDAIHNYQEALIRDPKNPKIWHNLAIMQLREASLSFFQVTQNSNENDPLFVRASEILSLYDKVQTSRKP